MPSALFGRKDSARIGSLGEDLDPTWVRSEYNQHAAMRSHERMATGWAMLDGEPYAFDSALISRNSWSTHENGP